MFAVEFKHRLYHATLNLLWRQWSALGVAGHAMPSKQDYVLDPEMLLLFSAYFCRYDARLYDLIIDWLRKNGSLVNIQRLHALAKRHSMDESPSLGYMAQCVSDNGERRWKKLSGELRQKRSSAPIPLFIQPDGTQNDFLHTSDSTALQYGFLRNPYQPSGKTSAFPTDTNAAFLLQLRGAFGLSARADTILALLVRKVCKIQEIAEVSAFAWKSIQDALEELCAASLVIACESQKRGRSFTLRNPQALLALFGKSAIQFPRWDLCFQTISLIWKALGDQRLQTVSEATVLGTLQDLLDAHMGDSLLYSGLEEMASVQANDLTKLPDRIDAI